MNSMNHISRRAAFSLLLFMIPIISNNESSAQPKAFTVHQQDTAVHAYEHGFAHQVMRAGNSGVKLWNHLLIENDAQGSGTSNKGPFTEPVFGDRMIKKVFTLDDQRCESARIVFFTWSSGSPAKPPLCVTINGKKITFKYRNANQYGYIALEPSWLMRGKNEVILACPGAASPEEGYIFLLSRTDEYDRGSHPDKNAYASTRPGERTGLRRIIGLRSDHAELFAQGDIGSCSFISADAGKTWSMKGKGMHPLNLENYGVRDIPGDSGVNGEYCVRLNMERHVSEGALVSPVIDLWNDTDRDAVIVPFTEVGNLTLTFRGVEPVGTKIQWQIRAGVSLDPLRHNDWTEWITVAEGDSAIVEPHARLPLPAVHWDSERSVTLPAVRYIQWRAILSTQNPLVSPDVHSVDIDRIFTRNMNMPKNIFFTGIDNPVIAYSSSDFTYQDAGDAWNAPVIGRDDLDAVVRKTEGEFDAIVSLLDFAARRWVYGDPLIDFPRWNTADITERAHSLGNGGMCAQFGMYLAHILTVMGYPARHVNISGPGGHEVTEVWSNDFGKWVFLDPTQGADYYLYRTETGIPLSIKEMHDAYYTLWGINKPIDWMSPYEERLALEKDYSRLPIEYSTTDPRIVMQEFEGGFRMAYDLAESIKMMPRNDFSSNLYPEPLQQGSIEWPWDGYINWYDELSPPKPQYSRHTDRACDLWPTLNTVRFEAVPDIYGEKAFVAMTTFTPSFKSFQISIDDGAWRDSDDRFTWFLHHGINKVEMRSVSHFGIAGRPSGISCNYVVKHYPKASRTGSVD